ncbi:two-component system C4-dicarboxylate transport sensor histidine kinase DctB [Pseudomonas sp. BIGb0408]|uniref:histidine kinase n=1 Tax=Phytopseudomonas flavescens TaxID=29435 RepID=A0A7Y9XT74_9GAMM|nr:MULTISPECIES: ATP-binding protein [Pseudomonas]MCW2295079.1 two-component system C4-dicarboxylate transport sensor histidine kinase DctB [Pseudomonas sp. BIGb0408]NYH75647.1 two-component system C4-dicarboxylate transport sensor histidine kinase DctB [Pseudomonas flavescens]
MSSRSLRVALLTALLLAGLCLSAYLAERQAERHRLADAGQQAQEQLAAYAGALQTLIDRYRALPAVLALDPELKEALQSPLTPMLQHRLNLKLEATNTAAHSSTLQVMNADGLSIAASNWRLPTSYVGHDYSFRPYFSESRSQDTGRFYAVGVTSGIPGYFLSHAVRDDSGRFLGTVVVKLEFPSIEQAWSQSPHVLLVSDRQGISFIANRPAWRYRELRPISAGVRETLATTRQYDKKPLAPLNYRQRQSLADEGRLVRIDSPELAGDYLWETRALASEGWTLHLLRDTRSIADSTHTASLAAGGAWLALVLLGLVVHQRWRIARLRQRASDDLQALVEQRTAALRTAQDGLVQAAKLAALGQMSAALAHEINQPLTALQVHLGTLRMILADGELEEARQSLVRHEELLQRMAALAGHLKTYARKSPGGLRETLELGAVLDKALQLLEPRLRDVEVQIQRTPEQPAWVAGDAIRLEQVLVNLIRNALDAMQQSPAPRLAFELTLTDDHWSLHIDDSGAGIDAEALPQLFDPFFTTKPVGDGLGLGLAVSYAIVRELDGDLLATNRPEGGARFTLRLPAATAPQEFA